MCVFRTTSSLTPNPTTTNLSSSSLHPEFMSCFPDSEFFSPHPHPPHPHSVLSPYLFPGGWSCNLPGLSFLSCPPPDPNSDWCPPNLYIAIANSTRTSSITENKIQKGFSHDGFLSRSSVSATAWMTDSYSLLAAQKVMTQTPRFHNLIR